MKHPYLYLWRKFLLWLRKSWSFLWLVGVALYLMFLGGQAVYRNYQSQQEIVTLKQRLAQAEIERDKLEALLVYYQTDSFKEKELRRSLLLKRPEEKVYALPESGVAKLAEEAIAAEAAELEATKAQNGSMPVWQQWGRYLWYGEEAVN